MWRNFDRLKGLFNRNKKAIAIGAAATATVGLLYLFFRKPSQPKTKRPSKQTPVQVVVETPVVQQTTINHQTPNTERPVISIKRSPTTTTADESPKESPYMIKARAIAKTIKVETIGMTKTYNLSTIQQVLEQSIELAEEDYIQITLTNRKDRRQNLNTEASVYEKLVIDYNEEVENVLKRAQQTILEILNVAYENFEDSVIDFMELGHTQEIQTFQAAIRQKLKQKIEPKEDLTIEKTKEIIRFQIDILKQQPELMKQLMKRLSGSQETVQLIPIIITNLLNDYIYNEFQVEEEDQMKVFTRPDLSSDHQIIVLLQEIEQAMFQVMQPYGLGI